MRNVPWATTLLFRYLDLLEAARGEFFRYLGTTFLQWQGRDTIFPVIEAHQRYISPARYDEVSRVELWIAKAKGVRLSFAYRITNQAGKPVLEAETLHVSPASTEDQNGCPGSLLMIKPLAGQLDDGSIWHAVGGGKARPSHSN